MYSCNCFSHEATQQHLSLHPNEIKSLKPELRKSWLQHQDYCLWLDRLHCSHTLSKSPGDKLNGSDALNHNVFETKISHWRWKPALKRRKNVSLPEKYPYQSGYSKLFMMFWCTEVKLGYSGVLSDNIFARIDTRGWRLRWLRSPWCLSQETIIPSFLPLNFLSIRVSRHVPVSLRPFHSDILSLWPFTISLGGQMAKQTLKCLQFLLRLDIWCEKEVWEVCGRL